MKTIKYKIFFLSLIMLVSCKNALDIAPASQYSDSFLETKSGLNAVLNSAYDNIEYDANEGSNRLYMEEVGTDIFINFRGLLNGNLTPYQNFTFNSSSVFIYDQYWAKCYRAVRDANIVLKTAETAPYLNATEQKAFMAEAHFIRGLAYDFLYGWFGTVPLVEKVYTSSKEEFDLPRADEAVLKSFIETELSAAATDLPLTALTGKATKGAALGILAKYYLQTKQWTLAAETAKQVMDLDIYNILPDYASVFALNNEGNKEMVYVFPCLNIDGNGNVWVANALPPQYPTNILNTATQVCTPVAFYNSFSPTDKRKTLFLTTYVNTKGQTIDLTTGVEYQNPRSLKYPIDVTADARTGGQDIPLIRYSDILLTRAEALVMSSGTVSQEAIDLFNKIRNRAGLSSYTLADLPTQAILIDKLLQERAWEFYSEGKRREDLIRHNRYISDAVARGKDAKPYQVLYPIPQTEMDANKNLVQNPGYNQ